MTEFELIQRLTFEIDQVKMLNHHLKGLIEHYESDCSYYKEKLIDLENSLAIEPVVSMYKVHKEADFSAYYLSIVQKRLEKIQERLEKLDNDFIQDRVKS